MKKILLSLILTIIVFTVQAQEWSQLVKLEASDRESGDNQGNAVAISGDYVIAGAWHEDYDPAVGAGYDAGAAYIYHYNSATEEWTEEAKLIAADREWLDEFGRSVDISGTYAVVGAVREEASSGAAYVYERNSDGTWIQVKKLVAPVRHSNDRFACSVSISGNTILVGARYEDEDENDMNTIQNRGSAYIFTRSNNGVWGFSQKIVASNRENSGEFGHAVAIHEDKIIIGAHTYQEDGGVALRGAAYVFSLDGDSWVESRIIKAVTPFSGDDFGWSVDVYHPYYIIGAPKHSFTDTDGNPANGSGAAYIYDASNNWAETKIVANNPHSIDHLGHAVAIHGTRAVVGAPLQDYGIDGEPPYWGNGGAAFVYEKDDSGFWNQTQKLLADDRFSGDIFGQTVDLNSTIIIGGAPEDNGAEFASTGSLYLFEITETVALNNINIKETLHVYPNPTNGKVNIDLGKTYSELVLSFRNMLGQIIFTRRYNETGFISFEIEETPGIYLISLSTEEEKLATFRVVKN